jgi:hypothetical protein
MRGERAAPEILMQEDAPIWTRLYSTAEAEVPAAACAQLSSVLAELGADRMIVGHTPQPNGINAACAGKVWRIDSGLSHFYGGPLQWLEIDGTKVSVRQ